MDRRELDRRSGTLIALAGVVGTLIGSGVALIGIMVQANSSEDAIEAQADQAQRTFVLNERRNAYSTMLAADSQATALEQEMASYQGAGVEHAQLLDLEQRIRAANNELQGAVSLIEVAGRTETTATAREVRDAHAECLAASWLLLRDETLDVPDQATENNYARWEAATSTAQHASAEFLAAVRNDLGIEE